MNLFLRSGIAVAPLWALLSPAFAQEVRKDDGKSTFDSVTAAYQRLTKAGEFLPSEAPPWFKGDHYVLTQEEEEEGNRLHEEAALLENPNAKQDAAAFEAGRQATLHELNEVALSRDPSGQEPKAPTTSDEDATKPPTPTEPTVPKVPETEPPEGEPVDAGDSNDSDEEAEAEAEGEAEAEAEAEGETDPDDENTSLMPDYESPEPMSLEEMEQWGQGLKQVYIAPDLERPQKTSLEEMVRWGQGPRVVYAGSAEGAAATVNALFAGPDVLALTYGADDPITFLRIGSAFSVSSSDGRIVGLDESTIRSAFEGGALPVELEAFLSGAR